MVTISDFEVSCDDDLSSPTEPSPRGGAVRQISIDLPAVTARMNGAGAFEGDRYRSEGDTEAYIQVRGHQVADGRFHGELTYRTLTLASPSSPGSTCFSFPTNWHAERPARGTKTAVLQGTTAPRFGRAKPTQEQWATTVAGQPEATIRFAVTPNEQGDQLVHFEPEGVELRCDNGRTPKLRNGLALKVNEFGKFRRVDEYLNEYGGWGLYSLHGEVRSERRARGTLLLMSHSVNPFGGPQHSCTSDGPIVWSARR